MNCLVIRHCSSLIARRAINFRPPRLSPTVANFSITSYNRNQDLKHSESIITKSDLRFNDNIDKAPPVAPKWEDATEIVGNSDITGAILPFSELNFLQIIFFPYTYSAMYYLDFLTQHLPWWLAIVGTTATIRLAFFPLVIKQNIVGIKLYNILPETQRIQIKVNDAMATGNGYEAAINKTKLKLLYDEHDVSVKKRLLPIFFQAPMFMSLFFLLRRISYHPVEALTTGGAFWFTNLTVPDPFFILPIMTSTSMWLLMEFGLEGSAGPLSGMGPMGRWLMRALPIGLFAFIYNFPAAVLLFWTTNNIFTLCYALLLKNKFVKKKLGIPNRLVHAPESLPLTNQTFSSQIKSAVDQSKANRTSIDVRRLDDIAFRKAGVGPLRKTYKTPPKLDE